LAAAPALILRFPTDDPATRELTAADIDGTGAIAIHDTDDREWRVFYETPETRDAAGGTLARAARAHGPAIVPIDVDDEDWARRSQAQLTAIRVGDVIVAPPWDLPQGPGTGGQGSEAIDLHFPATDPRPPAPGTPPILIVIEPSVGFGTGHHASTRLCLHALQRIELDGKRVIDVGTGSGVLAIAAVKLGAELVTAIDTDADAVANARQNAARNGVAIDLHVADVADVGRLDPGVPRTYDVVLANLTAAWLRRLAIPLVALTSSGACLVLSGIQTFERETVADAFSSRRVDQELEEDGWIALVLR
jgi:ribosomal protein L11 methylase PrmA